MPGTKNHRIPRPATARPITTTLQRFTDFIADPCRRLDLFRFIVNNFLWCSTAANNLFRCSGNGLPRRLRRNNRGREKSKKANIRPDRAMVQRPGNPLRKSANCRHTMDSSRSTCTVNIVHTTQVLLRHNRGARRTATAGNDSSPAQEGLRTASEEGIQKGFSCA